MAQRYRGSRPRRRSMRAVMRAGPRPPRPPGYVNRPTSLLNCGVRDEPPTPRCPPRGPRRAPCARAGGPCPARPRRGRHRRGDRGRAAGRRLGDRRLRPRLRRCAASISPAPSWSGSASSTRGCAAATWPTSRRWSRAGCVRSSGLPPDRDPPLHGLPARRHLRRLPDRPRVLRLIAPAAGHLRGLHPSPERLPRVRAAVRALSSLRPHPGRFPGRPAAALRAATAAI